MSSHECDDICSPDSCFKAKLRYWRDHGMNVVIPQGWGGPTIRERVDQQVSEAKANGYDPVPASPKSRWV